MEKVQHSAGERLAVFPPFSIHDPARRLPAGTALLLILAMLATACVHRAAVKKEIEIPVEGPKVPSTAGVPAKSSADGTFQTILHQQVQGALDPLKEDPRITTLQDQVKGNPQDPSARMDLAQSYERYGLFDLGLEQYQAALQAVLAAPEDKEAQAERAILGLGRCAAASGRIEEVLPRMEDSVQQWPGPAAWNALGILYDETGRLEKGEKAFREAIARNGPSSLLQNNLGYNLFLQNREEAAENQLRSALQLNAESVVARNNMGLLLARRGDFSGALAQFSRSADMASAHNNLGVALLEAGEYERSRQELLEALALRPYFAPALANFRLVQERICERSGAANCGNQPLATPPPNDDE